MSQHRTVQRAIAQHSPKMGQLAPILTEHEPTCFPTQIHVAPTWTQHGPTWIQHSSRVNTAPTWSHDSCWHMQRCPRTPRFEPKRRSRGEWTKCRRPLGKRFLKSSGAHRGRARPRQDLREMGLQKWSGCLAGHWGKLFRQYFWNEGEVMKTT